MRRMSNGVRIAFGGEAANSILIGTLSGFRNSVVGNVPTGFRNDRQVLGFLTQDGHTQIGVTQITDIGDGGCQVRFHANSGITLSTMSYIRPGEFFFVTPDAWPTTLPGTSA